MAQRIPVGIVFNPNWWNQNYGIVFDETFYFDLPARIRKDVIMRRTLYERFGIGDSDPKPRPIVGSMHVAGGFVLPALFGVEIRFAAGQAPWPLPANLGAAEVLALRAPDFRRTWPMRDWIADMDALDREFGCVLGDFDTDGILNTALQIRGQDLYTDMIENPKMAHHLFSVITETQAQVAEYVASRTGTSSVSTNRSILNVKPGIYLHSNCSVCMISPRLYREALLPHERRLAERLKPYGIHHCGNNLHRFLGAYVELPLSFLDVGWGSDVAECRRAFPGAFLNLRLSPVRMLHLTADEIRNDVERLITAAGSTESIGICAINMDYGTPDENVKAVFEVARAHSNSRWL
jgi:hypothetical protein